MPDRLDDLLNQSVQIEERIKLRIRSIGVHF